MKEQKEKQKIIVMAILLAICCALTYYFHAILEIETVFTHFFYIPIILACIWWKRKGLVIAIFLAGLLIFSHTFRVTPPTGNDCLRALMLIAIGTVVAILSEMIAKVQTRISHLLKAVETTKEAIAITTPDSMITYANNAMYDLYGYKKGELIGKSVSILNAGPPEKVKEVTKQITDTVKKEGVWGGEIVNRRKDGTEFFCYAKISGLRDENAKIINYVSAQHDITEQKRAEEALRMFGEEMELKVEERTKELTKERDYVRHLMESSPDFQLTLDKEGTILDVNKAFEQFIGKNRKDVISSSIYKYIEREKIEQLIRAIANKENIRNRELTVNIADKGTLILNISGTVFTTGEVEEGFYLTGRDLTEAKAKEAQLIHAGRLSSLGEMASGMAHEINQPLAIISLTAEGVLRDIEKNRVDISRFPKDLEDILKSVKRIDTIITHMRAFSRKPEEIIVIKPETVLNNVFTLLGAQLKMHSISVSFNIGANLPAIIVDPNQLEQVFVNILTNARQVLDERVENAKEEGVRFEKQLVCGISREREKGKEWVVYEFADNGYGVPEESKTRVFEPFFTTKKAGEGTGLGLSIAYRILTQALNGKIWVEDNDMGGASFKVALPVKDKTAETRRNQK